MDKQSEVRRKAPHESCMNNTEKASGKLRRATERGNQFKQVVKKR